MKFSQLSYLAVLACSQLAAADGEVHGEGVVGTKMGPVAFLWPDDRNWSATADNTAPCGSTDGVVNRTDFPLSKYPQPRIETYILADYPRLRLAQGTVALSIGEDATNVKFSIAYDNSK